MWSSQRRWREKEIPVTERLCRVGLHREERGRSGRDEQQLSDILFVPPPPSRLHYDSFSVRVKVRPDSSAAVYGYVCFFCVYVCSRGCFAAPIQNRWGEMEMKRVRRRTRQRDLSVGSESLCFVDEAGRHPEVLGGRVRLIPHAWLEV